MQLFWPALHLLALGIGLGAVFARGRAFRARDLVGAFYADNWWGIAALIWISTGLYRAFGGIEKGTAYYLHNSMFHIKMGLFGLSFLLELWPMVTLIRWRVAQGRGEVVDTSLMGWFYWINLVEVVLLVLIPFFAVGMARGFGL